MEAQRVNKIFREYRSVIELVVAVLEGRDGAKHVRNVHLAVYTIDEAGTKTERGNLLWVSYIEVFVTRDDIFTDTKVYFYNLERALTFR